MGLNSTLRFIVSHPMNRGRPIAALARFAKWQIQSRLQDEVIVDWIDGAKLAARRGMTGATGNIYCGLHEYVDMRFVLDTLKPGDLFVDIGANVGSYTVLASKICGAHTIAVEPDPDTVRALKRNIAVNGIEDRVEVVEAALGAQSGAASFTTGRDTTNRVAKSTDKEVRNVAMATLDEIVGERQPAIIKIDIEGHEASVLMGGTATLAKPRLRAVITEAQEKDVMDILNQAGFKRVWYDPDRMAIAAKAAWASNNALLIRSAAWPDGAKGNAVRAPRAQRAS